MPSTKLEREASAQHYGFIEERLAGLEDIRANGGGEHAMRRFIHSMRTYYFDTRRAWAHADDYLALELRAFCRR